MKHCPTCGQPILPSMGDRVARAVDKAAQTDVRPAQSQLAEGVALTVHVGNSTFSPKAELTPRGYKTQHIIRHGGKRYRIRLALLSFPRKGTMGGKLTVIALGEDRKVTTHELPEQPTTHPIAPFQHDWHLPTSFSEEVVPVRVVLTA